MCFDSLPNCGLNTNTNSFIVTKAVEFKDSMKTTQKH